MDADELLQSAAARNFARLRVSSNVEAILARVPRSDACKFPLLQCFLLLGRLLFQFAVIGHQLLDYGIPWQGFRTSALPFVELTLYTALVISGLWWVLRSAGLDASQPYVPKHNARWRRSARGARRLRVAAGFSGLRLLDGLRNVVPRVQDNIDKLTARSSTWHRLRGVPHLFWVIASELGKGLLGIWVLWAKLVSHDHSFFHLLGLANQMANIVEVQDVELHAVRRFVFTGEQAKWDDAKVDASREFDGRVLKRCVRHTRNHALGVAAYAAMSARDYQELVVSERDPDDAAAIAGGKLSWI